MKMKFKGGMSTYDDQLPHLNDVYYNAVTLVSRELKKKPRFPVNNSQKSLTGGFKSTKKAKKALDMFPASNAMTFQHIPKKPDYDEFLKKFKQEL